MLAQDNQSMKIKVAFLTAVFLIATFRLQQLHRFTPSQLQVAPLPTPSITMITLLVIFLQKKVAHLYLP